MKTLELKHLAPYLPYGLKLIGHTHGEIVEMSEVNENNVNIKNRGFQYGWWADIFDVSPILRPLSDLTKEFEYKGKKIQVLNELGFANSVDVKESLLFVIGKLHIPYSEFTKLCEWHFDVFGLIEKGLAIDINTI